MTYDYGVFLLDIHPLLLMFQKKTHPNMKAWKTTLPVFAFFVWEVFATARKRVSHPKTSPKKEIKKKWQCREEKELLKILRIWVENVDYSEGLQDTILQLTLKPIFLRENPFLSTAGNFSRGRYNISRHWLGNIGIVDCKHLVWLLWGFDEMSFVQFHFWHMDINNLPRDDRNDWSWRGIGSAHNY